MYFVILIILSGIGHFGTPYSGSEDCRQKVLAAYEASQLPAYKPVPGKALYTEILSKTYYRSPHNPGKGLQVGVTKTEYLTNGKRVYYSTGEVDVFQDEVAQVTILKKKKLIYINKLTGIEAFSVSMPNMRREVLQHAKVLSCEVAGSGENRVRKVRLKIDKATSAKSGAEEMEIWLDENKQLIKEVKLYLRKGLNIDRIDMSYQKHVEKETDILNKKAEAQVLDASGRLLAPYRGYELINDLKK